ncbi:MAG: nucleotidyltransferase domain-containing protein [Candidatus Thorarchaeota archaeon]
MVKKKTKAKKPKKKVSLKKYPTLKLAKEKDIAMDFATKVYQKFDKLVKAIILFGSQAKKTAVAGSDIDIIILIDDASIKWDQELIAWYREELGKIIKLNPYKKELHINSVKMTTWWNDLLRGDPVVINILRFGEAIIDFGGFFSPLKLLLQEGKIRSTPEAVYTALQRVPAHIARSKASEMNTIEGLYWAMVDSAHAALMAAKQTPPSPEHVPALLKEVFVDTGNLKIRYVIMYRDLYVLHRKIAHGEINDLKGVEIDEWQRLTEQFVQEMTRLVKSIVEKK